MSRTNKDRPRFVRDRESVDAGRIRHHCEGWRASPGHWVSVPNLSITIPKGDALALNDHRAFLTNLGEGYQFQEEENQPSRMDPIWKVYSPRTITFSVKRWVAPRTVECLDPEHYDVRTGRDTREGHITYCAPREPRGIIKCRHCGHNDCGCSGPTSATVRRMELRSIAEAFNSGVDLEDLEDLELGWDVTEDHAQNGWWSAC